MTYIKYDKQNLEIIVEIHDTIRKIIDEKIETEKHDPFMMGIVLIDEGISYLLGSVNGDKKKTYKLAKEKIKRTLELS